MIRKALISDIPSVLTICAACANHMISKGIYQWNEFYPSEEAFLLDIKRQELFVYLKNDQILGCIVISTHKDEEYEEVNWLTAEENSIYIHRLAVHPHFQSQGIAQKMMTFAESLGRENNMFSVRLDTFSQNKRNQRFYEQRGYTKLGDIFFPKQSEFPFHCYELIL